MERKLDLGGTLLAHQALLAGDIDMYPEYTGTGFTNVLKRSGVTDPAEVLEQVRAEYSSRFHLDWLDPLGFENSFAMTVRGEDARARHLETLSDAAADPAGFTLGAGYEFLTRPDAYGALNRRLFDQMERGSQEHGPRACSTRRSNRSRSAWPPPTPPTAC